VARIGNRRHIWSVLVRTSQRKRPLARDRLRWDDNIEMDHHEVGSKKRWGIFSLAADLLVSQEGLCSID